MPETLRQRQNSCRVHQVRNEREIEHEDAVLLIDHSPSYITSEVMEMLTEARVRVVTFAPLTTHIFQLLDLQGGQ
jgi:hypothetical protein